MIEVKKWGGFSLAAAQPQLPRLGWGIVGGGNLLDLDQDSSGGGELQAICINPGTLAPQYCQIGTPLFPGCEAVSAGSQHRWGLLPRPYIPAQPHPA